MLKQLKVQNFALINQAEINFQNTFVVITGETGAGKSILLDALSLALGSKSDASLAFDKSKKIIIEAVFDVSSLPIQSFFEENDIEFWNETILRREVQPDGKSRCFINDTPVNVSTLKQLGENLIDIHSQHQNLIINSATFRYNFIDSIAGCLNEREEFSQLFKQYQKDLVLLNQLIEQQQNAQKEIDYTQYLLNELIDAKLQEGELQSIEEELNQLENAENIIQNLSAAIQSLQEAEINAIQLLTQAKSNLQSIAKYHPKYNELAERLQSTIIEIKDIAHESENFLGDVEINPERIEQLNERLDIINKLLKKHNVKTDTELLQIQNNLQEKLNQFQNIDDIIIEKKKQLETLLTLLNQKAEQLSEKRMHVKSSIEKSCVEILNELSMPNAQFIVDIQKKEELTPYGKDEIKFLFTANKGVSPTEVHKAASGGEIARLMLSIKSLMAKHVHLPTIIFDEIDTGVSGNVAAKMGAIMQQMSQHIQVISITHLPQIAAKGKQHFYVYKKEIDNKTITFIKELNKEERIQEIAKMLSAGTPGDAAIQNAKELLQHT
ncbi:MAG: DNA repair protein RecN [Bacteroidia bacterium]|nr:MAG: DNA repair protein RecN [Bacteroidia bacterium]